MYKSALSSPSVPIMLFQETKLQHFNCSVNKFVWLLLEQITENKISCSFFFNIKLLWEFQPSVFPPQESVPFKPGILAWLQLPVALFRPSSLPLKWRQIQPSYSHKVNAEISWTQSSETHIALIYKKTVLVNFPFSPASELSTQKLMTILPLLLMTVQCGYPNPTSSGQMQTSIWKLIVQGKFSRQWWKISISWAKSIL